MRSKVSKEKSGTQNKIVRVNIGTVVLHVVYEAYMISLLCFIQLHYKEVQVRPGYNIHLCQAH